MVRDLIADNRELITMDDDTVLGCATLRSNWASAGA
jgi:hypothetical protein